jgi:hypothetical protein
VVLPHLRVDGMTPAEVAAAVEGYRVLRHRGHVFVQPRTAAEVKRLEQLGATVTSSTVYGQTYHEVHLTTMLDEPTETDDDGNLIDNRAEVLLSYFRERDGYPAGLPGRSA